MSGLNLTIRFDEFMEFALYDPDSGFFGGSHSQAGEAGGARGDFITSPEVGPLFGLLMSRYLDRVWHRLGAPAEFNVVEFAAGRGALAIAVRSAAPECVQALRYWMVERSPRLRALQAEHLSLAESSTPTDASSARAEPTFLSLATLDDVPSSQLGPVHVVLANELLDNMPIRLLELAGESAELWQEVWVVRHADIWSEALRPFESLSGPDDALTEGFSCLLDQISAEVGKIGSDFTPSTRAPFQRQAMEWLARSIDLVTPSGGSVLVIDYGRHTTEMAALPQDGWLRTYRGHERGGSLLTGPGTQDITCEVAFDQLAIVRPPTAALSQAAWLDTLGIDALVEEGRAIWKAKAASPDLGAFKARSRVNEAEALCDPAGLGGFTVSIWDC